MHPPLLIPLYFGLENILFVNYVSRPYDGDMAGQQSVVPHFPHSDRSDPQSLARGTDN